MSEKLTKHSRDSKLQLKGRMKSFIMFLPNMVRLLGRLLTDSRVPKAEKALFVAAIVYVISPLDFIPDVFPFIGQVDDLFLVALTLLRLIDHTDDLVVRQHWRGGGDIVQLAESAATLAPMLMPKRVARVLLSKVTPTSEGAGLLASAAKGQPVLVETPEREKQPDRLSKLADFGSKKRRSGSA